MIKDVAKDVLEYERRFKKAIQERVLVVCEMQKKQTWLSGFYDLVHAAYEELKQGLKALEGKLDQDTPNTTDAWAKAKWQLSICADMDERPSKTYRATWARIKAQVTSRIRSAIADKSVEPDVLEAVVAMLCAFEEPDIQLEKGEEKDKSKNWMLWAGLFLAGLVARDVVQAIFPERGSFLAGLVGGNKQTQALPESTQEAEAGGVV